MFYNMFLVLFWKNILARRRHYSIFMIELLTPIFWFIVLVTPREESGDCFIIGVNKFRKTSKETVPQFMYTPVNKATKMLMDEVARELKIPRFRSLPQNYEIIRSSGGSNEKEALENVTAVIIFENLNTGGTLPDNLNYTVQFKEKPRESGPTDETDKSFSKLQWAINSKFIQMKSNSSFTLQNVILREIPRIQVTFLRDEFGVTNVILYGLVFFTPLLSIVSLIIRLDAERCMGAEVLLEAAGVPWYTIDIVNFLDSLLPCFILSFITSCFSPMISNGLILFMCLFLHCASMIALAFLFCSITICGLNALSTAIFLYVGSFMFNLPIWDYGSNRLSLLVKGLVPYMPSNWIMYQYTINEFGSYFVIRVREGVQFKNWMIAANVEGTNEKLSVMESLGLLLVQTALFFGLSLFLRTDRKNKYGKGVALNFPFLNNFSRKLDDNSQSITLNNYPDFNRYFEDPTNDLNVAVEFVNVKKIYSSRLTSVVALNDVSLKIYRGKITVIVGHNGSGKTTLLSIIAGMQKPSSGKVLVGNLDTTIFKMNKKVAYCPQQSTLFPGLTVREHLLFFSKVAGDSAEDASKTTERVMTQMGLEPVKAWVPSEISIGLQRRLQIGCSLCSQANLLLLDDPTAEIDIEARRDLYHTLFALRGERTIIMSTTFSEEADILGDRVAALQQGVLCCYATPKFLKKTMDDGSRVNITSFQSTNSDLVTKMIRGVTPNATLSGHMMGSLSYNVPPGSNMTALLDTLESNRVALDIDSLGVGLATLEEVFIKLWTDGEPDKSEQVETVLQHFDGISQNDGLSLIKMQMKELFRRQLDYMYSRLPSLIFTRIISPIILTMFLGLYLTNWDSYGKYIRFDQDENRLSATYRLEGFELNKTQHIVDKMKEFFPQLRLQQSKVELGNALT